MPDADALFDEGFTLLGQRKYAQAAASFQGALALAPSFLEAQVNLAWTLEQQGRLSEAEAWYRRALEADPACLEAHRNLGVLLVGQKRFDESLGVYDRALERHPSSPALWSNRGALMASLNREAQAEACFRKALALDGTYGRARYNLGYLCLLRGEFEEGWLGHEARQRLPYTERLAFPQWLGESLQGRSLLIAAEAGHGDMIMFCRYASVLKAAGAARIGVLCQPALERLFGTLDGADEVLSLEDGLPATGWDCWALPMSLPFHCRTRLESIPAPIPYMHPLPRLVEAWRPRLPQGGLRVGLVWKGNPQFRTDGDRSLDNLACLAPLGAVKNATFISLQKGQGEEEARHPPVNLPLLDLGSRMEDFADTAAIMAGLDLVITVDTAAAHLAGALGVPCWVLIPDYWTDWRWLKDRTDSPWYPGTLRLFRQPQAGGWPPVIRKVAEALEALAKEKRDE